MQQATLLFCRGCKTSFDDGRDLCDRCGVYLVIPDPQPPQLPYFELGSQFHTLWKASCACAKGEASRGSLIGPLAGVAQKLEAIVGLPLLPQTVLEYATTSLRALERIRQFTASRYVLDLNQGWAQLLPAAAALREQAVRVGAVAEQPGGTPSEVPAGASSWADHMRDSVATFENPDD